MMTTHSGKGATSSAKGATSSSKRGRPTRDQAAGRQIELLDAALDHFLDKGFEQATIEAIARRVNMTKRTIYTRYPDKAALFQAAVSLAVERYAVSQEELAATDRATIEETLMAFAWLRVDQVLTPNGLKLQRIINAEGYRFPGILSDMFERSGMPSVRFLAGILERETRAGRLDVSECMEAATVFLSMVVGGPVRSIVLGQPLSQAEIAARIAFAVRLFLRGAQARTG